MFKAVHRYSADFVYMCTRTWQHSVPVVFTVELYYSRNLNTRCLYMINVHYSGMFVVLVDHRFT